MNFSEKDRDPRYWQALVIAEEMWEWLCDNPLKEKRDWPGYLRNNVNILDHECSICEYIWEEADSDCRDCCLDSTCYYSYHKWRYAGCEEESQEYSFEIWKTIFEERLRIMELHV